MPESERPDREREIESAFARLSAAVERVASEHEALRSGAARLESEYSSLRQAVGTSGGAGDEDLEARLAHLAAENRRLREVLAEARTRAERIRSQLVVVEDEV